MDFLRGRRLGAAGVAGACLLGLSGCDLGSPGTTYPAPGAVRGGGDVDGDGRLDLVASGNDEQFGVLLGDGSGGFTPTTVPHTTRCDPSQPSLTCSRVSVAQVVDVNGDGLSDVIVTYNLQSSDPPPGDRNEQVIDVRLADGSGGFGAPLAAGTFDLRTTQEPTWSFRDVTGDGLPDLIAVDSPFGSSSPQSIRVRAGDGTGAFGSPVVSPVPSGHQLVSINTADLDDEGHPDLVLGMTCVQGSGEDLLRACVDVLLSDGSGAFPSSTRRVLPDPEADGLFGLAFGDFDEDGDLDVISGVTGSDFDGGGQVGALALFPGDGAGGLGAAVSIPEVQQAVGVTLADFDVDGHLDALVATDDADGETSDDFGRLSFGDGTGGLSELHLLPTGVGVVADFDADGRPDFARTTAGGVEVFMNRWDGRPE